MAVAAFSFSFSEMFGLGRSQLKLLVIVFGYTLGFGGDEELALMAGEIRPCAGHLKTGTDADAGGVCGFSDPGLSFAVEFIFTELMNGLFDVGGAPKKRGLTGRGETPGALNAANGFCGPGPM